MFTWFSKTKPTKCLYLVELYIDHFCLVDLVSERLVELCIEHNSVVELYIRLNTAVELCTQAMIVSRPYRTKSWKLIHKAHSKFLYWNIYLVTLVGIIYSNYRKTQENYNSFKVADDKNMWLQTRILIWKYIPNKYYNDAMTPSVIMHSGTNLFKQVRQCSSYSTCYF